MIVGEAPGEKEVDEGRPFVGASGWLLDQTLEEAGLHRGQAFVTNVLRIRPPGNDASTHMATEKKRPDDFLFHNGRWISPDLHYGLQLLALELQANSPTLVIALGNVALWALTGEWGIRKWRGSILQGKQGEVNFKVLPTYHPAAVLREWPLRRILVHDLRRAAAELPRGPVVNPPPWNFTIRPSLPQVVEILDTIIRRLSETETPIPISADIETRNNHIACLGLAWTQFDALCIPFMTTTRPNYWTIEEEAEIVGMLRTILTHPRAFIIGQNWSYDQQYIDRYHLYTPSLGRDTMLAHHAMFSASPKGLDFLSSMYCAFHRYWKDDGKLWDPSMGEDQFWRYNAEDCVRTYEVAMAEADTIKALSANWPKLPEVEHFQQRLQPVVVRMMLRGVRNDPVARAKMATDLMSRSAELQAEINELAGTELNIRSPKQMTTYFYETLNQTPIYSRGADGKRGNMTCDDEALAKLSSREPLLRPIISRITALRSVGVFLSTFVNMPLDVDGRIRCSYNVAGTITYRFSSSKNAFGSGGNLQNIPAGSSDIELPNIRNLFVPDSGMTWFDLDGDSADLRIVTGESGCRAMQGYFAAGIKPYVEIAKEFYRDPTITKKHPSYKTMKALCHGSNYRGQARGLSAILGLPVHEIERMQRWYFGMCPEIAQWQADIVNQVNSRGYIENPFGQRMWFWDRISNTTYNEAIAWIPQSSVGRLINTIALRIDSGAPDVQLLLQVHDSLDGQFPTHLAAPCKRQILELAHVVIPCRLENVVVPMAIKTSTKSWGDCE